MSPAERKDWIKWCNTMLAASLIAPAPAPANTPVAAPFFFVWKKDGTCCPVIDYHKLNNIMIRDSYPLPCINEMLECMQGANVKSRPEMVISKNKGVDKIEWTSVLVQHRLDRIPRRARKRESNDEERVRRSKEE